MSNDKEKKCECVCSDKYEVVADKEKKKVDPSKPCDETNPNYPWEPCGIDNKPKDGEKK